MLGRYPYVEPSRCKSRAVGEDQLKKILEAGMRTFVCLQDELPPQEDMRVGGEKGFLPYKATAELIASSLSGPPPASIVNGLRNPYVDKFLPPNRKGSSPIPRGANELDFIHFPIVDLSLPAIRRLEELIQHLEQQVRSGNGVYAHCWGGRGRAGIVGACLISKLYGLDADEALYRTSVAFQTRSDPGFRSPQTDEQIDFVREYIRIRT